MVFTALAMLTLLFGTTLVAWRDKRRCLELRSHRGGRRLVCRAYRPKHAWDCPSVAVSLELARALPDGVEVRDVAGLRRAWTEGGVLHLDGEVRLFPRWLARWRLEGSGLRGRWLTLALDAPVSETPRLAGRVEALADALERASAGSWPDEGARLGLHWDGEGLHGEVEGRPVSVRLQDGAPLLSVGVPTDLRAVAGRGRTGSPVQDMFVQANRALAPDAVPALMAVVHGCPGSWVQPGRVCLRLRGGAPDLAEALSRALALAHALEPARRGDTLPG